MVLVTRIVITYYGREQEYLVSKNKSIFGVFTNAYEASEIINNEYKLDNNSKRLNIFNAHFNVYAKNGGCIEWTTKNKCFEGETKKIFTIREINEEVTDTIYEIFKNERGEID